MIGFAPTRPLMGLALGAIAGAIFARIGTPIRWKRRCKHSLACQRGIAVVAKTTSSS
jgi:hypothetical protein